MAKDKASQEAPQSQNISVSANLDNTPILYTDNVMISISDEGVVLDVTQKLVSSNQVRIVSRIGMSRTHAKKFAAEIGKLLALTESKGGKE